MMNERIQRVLSGRMENHILPFFWQHGEDEQTLREYMAVIDACHIGAVCVESRPHPDFVGEKWWTDMDVILDEAIKRQMKVWILDDSHFPTGYANGAVEKAPFALHRRGLCYQSMAVGKNGVNVDVRRFLRRNEQKKGLLDALTGSKGKKLPKPPADELLSVTAIRTDRWEAPLDLTDQLQDGKLRFTPAEGVWKIGLTKLSYRCGMHPNYINMMDPASVRILIDTVYEPHYEHYGELFGTTIAGFFSDEPEFGNGPLYKYNKNLGTPVDQPWSDTLIPYLERSLGAGWKNLLPLLWENDADSDMTALVRYAFMDAATRQVQTAFSQQLGDWCRAHGVQYIGHMIEDNNMHARTGSGLGHYFRCLSGQDMAGIDDIGGQVNPGQEDGPNRYFKFMERDGEFFHYALGKLAGSLAAIDPTKHGNAMCEIFGNYGWSEGFRLEKYLADHFMVRGVNHFVPHAFSPKPFPDVDCPPHFYAGGHDPEYRHFSALMDYMNRVSSLISGGHHVPDAAILYHAEAEWAGNCMFLQKPARALLDNQIDFDIIPTDVFTEREKYRTEITSAFQVNGQRYKALIVPYAQFISSALVQAIIELRTAGIPVYFVDALPEGVYDAAGCDLSVLKHCEVIALDELVDRLRRDRVPELSITPANDRIRMLHYQNGYEMFYFVNEGETTWRGEITLSVTGSAAIYRAERNALEKADIRESDGCSVLRAEIPTRQSLIVLFDNFGGTSLQEPWEKQVSVMESISFDGLWKRSQCKGIDYPQFTAQRSVSLPDHLAEEQPKFSGVVCYENSFEIDKTSRVLLEITDAYEGVQLFVNGQSAGIQVVPRYRFDITELVHAGKNTLRIEVSTTLERQRRAGKESVLELLQHNKTMQPTGLTGEVKLYAR